MIQAMKQAKSSSICEINAVRFSTSLAFFRFSNDAELPGLVVLGKPLSGTVRTWQMTVLYFVFHLQGVSKSSAEIIKTCVKMHR